MQHDWTIIKAGGGSLIGFLITQALILGGVLIFEPRPTTFITIIISFSIIWEAISNYRKKVLPTSFSIIKRNISLLLYMIFILYITEYFGGWGLLGFFIIIIIIVISILYRRWDLYMESVRKIESMIWGEPLDKKKR